MATSIGRMVLAIVAGGASVVWAQASPVTSQSMRVTRGLHRGHHHVNNCAPVKPTPTVFVPVQKPGVIRTRVGGVRPGPFPNVYPTGRLTGGGNSTPVVIEPRRPFVVPGSHGGTFGRGPIGRDGGGSVFIDDGGFELNGRVRSDDFALDVHVGTPTLSFIPGGGCIIDPCCRYPYWLNGYYWSGWYYGDDDWDSNYPIQGTSTIVVDPALLTAQQLAQATPAAPASPPTLMQQAEAAIITGSLVEAERVLRELLKSEPNNAWAMRFLALVLFESGRRQDGLALLGYAYHRDPFLGGEPVDKRLFAERGGRLRGLVNRAVAMAHQTQSSSAWLMATVLVQAEGRTGVADTMLGKARQAGLEPEVAAELARALAQ